MEYNVNVRLRMEEYPGFLAFLSEELLEKKKHQIIQGFYAFRYKTLDDIGTERVLISIKGSNPDFREEFDKKIKIIEEGGRRRIREFHKEIKEWKRNKEKLYEKLENIEKKKEPLFERLGKEVDDSRENQKELSLFFSQIDRSNERIAELEHQIKNL